MTFTHPKEVQTFLLDHSFDGGLRGELAEKIWHKVHDFIVSQPVKFIDYPLYGVYEKRWQVYYQTFIDPDLQLLISMVS